IRFLELVGVRRVGYFAVQRHDIAAAGAQGDEGVAVCLARRFLFTYLVSRQFHRLRMGQRRGRLLFRLRRRDGDVAHAAEFGEGGFLHVRRQRLAVPAVLIGYLGKTVALLCLGDETGRLLLLVQRLGVGAVDGVEIVAVQLDGVPAEGASARGV